MTDPSPEELLVVRRVIPVPRDRVFDAWLDAKSLVIWMRPGNATHAVAEVDPRIGGKFRIVMSHTEDVEHTGEYLAIERPRLLSFTWRSVYTDLIPTVVTIEFLERAEGTEVVLTHRRLPTSQLDNHRGGWTDILRLLGERLVPGGTG
jgi:uncharacterized protein YndB with AHSA1/START domain